MSAVDRHGRSAKARSAWQAYIGQDLPPPTTADRARIEKAGGGAVPDAYWALVRAHQGQVEEREVEVPGQGRAGFGVLLLATAPEEAGADQSYCIEWCLANMADCHPAGLLPFADDTGGNYWAFDFRAGGEPRIVFIDHELHGENGVVPVAGSFSAFMAA